MPVQQEPKELFFRTALLHWHRTDNHRQLPWKNIQDPYRIWLSEIILQQTRAGQGIPYYQKFTEHYPTLQSLADAGDQEVFRLWQGLGYYARCRNMLATARFVHKDLDGCWPTTAAALQQLKGIGSYTAAAIASFAFGEAAAVVDGNVNRLLARVFGIFDVPHSTAGKKNFGKLARLLLDPAQPATYNQAIMDFGATICTPAAPLCLLCPLQPHCYAYLHGVIPQLPVKKEKAPIMQRHFHYVLLRQKDAVWLHQREANDIWHGLYEPFLLEAATSLTAAELNAQVPEPPWLKNSLMLLSTTSQKLTHRLVYCTFFSAEPDVPLLKNHVGSWVPATQLDAYAMPRLLTRFFEKNGYF